MAAVGGWRFARASAPVSGPIILISVDTLRADRLPVYGGTGVRTPAIDLLAADGVVFERAYTPSSQTLPAHASMLSGRLPFRTGVRDNVGFKVNDDERMLAEVLRDRGYATAGIVSSYVLRKETGINQGFTFFDGGTIESSSPVLESLDRDGAEAHEIAERWLASARTDRAFLFLHLYEPHKPYRSRPEYLEYTAYDSEIAYVDEIIGRLVQYLKSHQLYDRSTLILVSDHGEGLGDHGEQEHGLFVYEEVVRVPLIIKPAASEGRGRRVRDLVQLVDLMPTIVDFAKAPLPGNLDGRSLTPLLHGTGRLPGRIAYSEALYGRYHFGWSELASVTDGRYRYIHAPQEELYDLEQDGRQQVNLAAQRTQETARLRNALLELDRERVVPSRGFVHPEEHRRLESLGYVGTYRAAAAQTDTPLPDPKDKWPVLESYREAVEHTVRQQWSPAMNVFKRILEEEPAMADVWRQLAASAAQAGLPDQAVDAYRQAATLDPDDARTPLDSAAVLLQMRRLDDARLQAGLAVGLADEFDADFRAAANELLARIALARRNLVSARSHAEYAQQWLPGLPLPDYVEGRLLYDRGFYTDALPFFEAAARRVERPDGRPIADLRFHIADILLRQRRFDEAEVELLEEIEDFPRNIPARVELAALYHRLGRTEEAGEVLTEVLRVKPTPETYSQVARLWGSFGNTEQAGAVRAEAARVFSPEPGTRPQSGHQ
jgi:arylsulfatase A-like enzyme/Flp pilus assembly protein TadD